MAQQIGPAVQRLSLVSAQQAALPKTPNGEQTSLRRLAHLDLANAPSSIVQESVRALAESLRNVPGQCAICLEDFDFAEFFSGELETCGRGHSFHDHCIREWEGHGENCPIDRQPFNSNGDNPASTTSQPTPSQRFAGNPFNSPIPAPTFTPTYDQPVDTGGPTGSLLALASQWAIGIGAHSLIPSTSTTTATPTRGPTTQEPTAPPTESSVIEGIELYYQDFTSESPRSSAVSLGQNIQAGLVIDQSWLDADPMNVMPNLALSLGIEISVLINGENLVLNASENNIPSVHLIYQGDGENGHFVFVGQDDTVNGNLGHRLFDNINDQLIANNNQDKAALLAVLLQHPFAQANNNQ